MDTITVTTWEGFADHAAELARRRGGEVSLRQRDRFILLHPSGGAIFAYRHTDPEEVEVATGQLVDISRISHRHGLSIITGIMDGGATEVAMVDEGDRWVGAEWSVEHAGGSVHGGGAWDEDGPSAVRRFVRQLEAWSN